MKFLSSIIFYAIALFSVLQGWLFAAGAAIIISSFLFSPGYFIPLAILLDGYLGSFYSLPILSLGAVVWFVVVEFFQPILIDFKNR